jgi:hypothetical protein
VIPVPCFLPVLIQTDCKFTVPVSVQQENAEKELHLFSSCGMIRTDFPVQYLKGQAVDTERSLLELFTDKLIEETKKNLIRWRPAKRLDSLAVKKQFDHYRNEYGLDSPSEAFLCDLKQGRLLLLQIVKTTLKPGSVIHAEYDYRLCIQPEGKGDFLSLSDHEAISVMEQLSELRYSENDKRYTDSKAQALFRFIISIINDNPLLSST